MAITECGLKHNSGETVSLLLSSTNLSHVTQSNGSLTGAVHEQVAFLRVELRGCDHLGELLHVGWLDVNDVE